MAKTLTATPDPDTGKVTLVLVWDGTAPTVSRYDPDLVWRTVTRADPAFLTGGGWTGSDYEAPTDAEVTYAVRDADAGTLVGPTVTLDSDGVTWLKHLTKPYLNVQAQVTDPPDLSYPVEQGVFSVLGRVAPVAITTIRGSARGELRLTTATDEERSDIRSLLADGSVLYLSTPTGYGIGSVWIAPGKLDEDRASGAGREPTRLWTLPFVVVDRPR